MTAELEPDPVWVVDDTGFPKQGRAFGGGGAAIFRHAGQDGQLPGGGEPASVGEQRKVPSWAGGCICRRVGRKDPQRRAEAGIPEEVKFQTKWELALEMIDEARAWGLRCGVVLADAGYGEGTEFREGLEARQLPYAVGIPSTVGVWTKPPRSCAESAGARASADGLPLRRAAAERGAGSGG